ncbi:MAG: Stp1/IreP family PP2C-type Ser/Thr phosphatase [Actinomycetota bacterium]
MTTFAAGAATDTGRIRANNQDRFLSADPVFVVADGMGGHMGGEIASEITVVSFEAVTTVHSIDDLIDQVQVANGQIVDRAREQPELKGMGTTVCVLADITRAGPNRIGIANVGDSRLYRLTADGLHQHTEDHSLVEALVRDGRLTRAEAAVHPQRNIVTRALGIDEKVLVDAWELIPVVGDRYLLCSDGLFNEVQGDEISEVLRAMPAPQEAAQELVDRANAAGGRDNITVVVVDIVGADSTDATPPDDRVTDVRKALPDGVLKVDKPSAAEHAAEMAAAADPHPDQVVAEPPATPIFTWRLGAMIAAVVIVLIVMFAVFLQIGRSGFTVGQADDGTVEILQGEGFLWFEPTVEVDTDLVVADLPALDRERVQAGQEFSSRSEADTYLAYLETLIDDEP